MQAEGRGHKGSASPGGSAAQFFGWRVVWAAFVLAGFGWGIGFYSPPVFLHAVVERTQWPLQLVSFAVTTHFLVGAVVVANLPRIYRHIAVYRIVMAGVVSLSVGVIGWALAYEPWQLFVAASLTGAGWVTMSAAGVNAVIAPWFARRRPAALALAYNGASLGGTLLVPIWAFLITWTDFPSAAVIIAVVMLPTVWFLALVYFAPTPESLGQEMDGGGERPPGSVGSGTAEFSPLPGLALWRNAAFLTLVAGMALALFAQIGLVAHLFSILVPALGERGAGLTMGAATLMAVAGRFMVGWFIPPNANRRNFVALSILVQIGGGLLLAAYVDGVAAVAVIAALLFGFGIGNATLLPPLIAQAEFAREDVFRVISLIIALSQGLSAFAPSLFGLIRAMEFSAAWPEDMAVRAVFLTAAGVQVLAIVSFLAVDGRRRT